MFLAGVLVGIGLTFSCIKLSMLFPVVSSVTNPNPTKNTKGSNKKRWNPGSLIPPQELPNLDPVSPSRKGGV